MCEDKHGNQVYVTDLGLATERRAAQANANTGRALNPNLVGTAAFASVNGHFGVGESNASALASRRLTDTQVQHCCDNLESLGYILLYFLPGCLLWQGLTATNQEQKEKLILAKKQTISTEDLCEGLPQAFATYLDHVRSRDFDDKPQYSYLRRMFRSLFVRQGFDHDYVFDWTILKCLMTIE